MTERPGGGPLRGLRRGVYTSGRPHGPDPSLVVGLEHQPSWRAVATFVTSGGHVTYRTFRTRPQGSRPRCGLLWVTPINPRLRPLAFCAHFGVGTHHRQGRSTIGALSVRVLGLATSHVRHKEKHDGRGNEPNNEPPYDRIQHLCLSFLWFHPPGVLAFCPRRCTCPHAGEVMRPCGSSGLPRGLLGTKLVHDGPSTPE